MYKDGPSPWIFSMSICFRDVASIFFRDVASFLMILTQMPLPIIQMPGSP